MSLLDAQKIVEGMASRGDAEAHGRVQAAKADQQPPRALDEKMEKRWVRQQIALHWLRFNGEVPKDVLCALLDRHTRQLHDAAERYGAPTRGKVVDVGRLLAWAFDWIAQNGRKLAQVEIAGDDLMMMGPKTPSLEKLRHENWKIAKIKREEMEHSKIEMQIVKEALTAAGQSLRSGAALLQREFGARAFEIYEEMLNSYDDALLRFFARLAVEEDVEAVGKHAAKRGDRGAGAQATHDAGVRRAGTGHRQGAVPRKVPRRAAAVRAAAAGRD
jgi:hypothetical protein